MFDKRCIYVQETMYIVHGYNTFYIMYAHQWFIFCKELIVVFPRLQGRGWIKQDTDLILSIKTCTRKRTQKYIVHSNERDEITL